MSDTSKGGFWAPICDLGKHLLDKLEKLGHYVTSPKGTMSQALETYITRIKEEHLPPLVEAYAIANAKKDIKEMANKRSIIQYALARLSEIPQPTPSEVVTPEQEEWFSRFFDSARHISDEEIQIIWGRILAEETAYPNSIPKSLIHSLSIIDKKSAIAFTRMCSYFVHVGNDDILVCDSIKKQGFWDNLCIDGAILNNLQAYGLISPSTDTEYYIRFVSSKSKVRKLPIKNLPINICGIDYIIMYQDYSDMPLGFKCGYVNLTNSGKALFRCVEKEYDDKCFNFVLNYIQKQIPHIMPLTHAASAVPKEEAQTKG